jgi:pimeloyl-ACP methyl ester carboxylesterase
MPLGVRFICRGLNPSLKGGIMSAWQSDYVETNGLRLHYTRTGGDKPPVVLAHGFSDDGLCWTPVAQQLEQAYDVIMVDARGHGRSDGPEQGYGSLEHAGDLAGVITALGLRRPAVLGHSMGAVSTLALAGAYPDLPGAILLEDPPPWWAGAPTPNSPQEAERRARMAGRMIALKRKTREELIADQRAETPYWPEAEFGPWADAKLRFSFHALNRSKVAAVDWPATVRRIACPALLITADPERGAIVSADNAAALRELLPHVRVAHIPGAGHSIRREQFDHYLEVVRAFLAGTTG